MIDYDLELNKIYTNDVKVKKYKLLYSGYKIISKDGQIKVTLDLRLDKKIESDLFVDQELAKQDCARKAIEEIQAIEYRLENSLNLFEFLSSKFKFFKSSYSKLIFNIFLALLILIFIILISPIWFYIKGYELGGCTGNRVIIHIAEYGNVFFKKTNYLYVGDLFIIKNQVIQQYPSNDDDDDDHDHDDHDDSEYFEVVLKKNVVLFADDDNPIYPTYVLPRLMGVYARRFNSGENYIVVLSYEKDGLPKRYVSKNVTDSAFDRNINTNKFNVFSKYGNHAHKERFISKINSISLYWGALCIYKDYIISNFFKGNSNDQDKIGFDKFQKVINLDITEY